MQKIIIKNFGPVKDAEIEIKKVLVLIGEQASGKSTIAKLIYFFKTLKEDVLNNVFDSSEFNDIENDLAKLIEKKFIIFWGLNQVNYEIVFYYSVEDNKYIKISANENNHLDIQFSENFLGQKFESLNTNFRDYFNRIKEQFQVNNKLSQDIDYQQDLFLRETMKRRDIYMISQLINQLFEDNQEGVFVIAGRNVTVSHSDLFDKDLYANLKNKKMPSIDEILTLKFMTQVSDLKDVFRKILGFEGGIEYHKNTEDKKKILEKIVGIVYTILKGSYVIDNLGEAIISKDKTKTYLNDSSSGQQEVIRILQDVFIILYLDQKVLRVIEEPEAHLFPIAQKQLIELLSLMVNYQPENQLIITTHSPYILTVFNHLLFASRVVAKNPAADAEVNEIVDKDCWLDPDEFSAYSLGNESFPEDNAAYCEPIFDTEQGMLEENYLDTVSEMLGYEFNSLYRIHGKTFKR